MRVAPELPGSGKHSPDDLFTAKGGGGKAVPLALQPGLEGQYIHVSHWRGGGSGAGGADDGLGAGVPLTTTMSNPVCWVEGGGALSVKKTQHTTRPHLHTYASKGWRAGRCAQERRARTNPCSVGIIEKLKLRCIRRHVNNAGARDTGRVIYKAGSGENCPSGGRPLATGRR